MNDLVLPQILQQELVGRCYPICVQPKKEPELFEALDQGLVLNRDLGSRARGPKATLDGVEQS